MDVQASKVPDTEILQRPVGNKCARPNIKWSNAMFFKLFVVVMQRSLIRELFTTEAYRKPDIQAKSQIWRVLSLSNRNSIDQHSNTVLTGPRLPPLLICAFQFSVNCVYFNRPKKRSKRMMNLRNRKVWQWETACKINIFFFILFLLIVTSWVLIILWDY